MKISNKQARHLWLHAQGLSPTPTGPATPDRLMEIIKGLGFVQLDTLQIVARAHHHILWSRNQNYREPMFDKMLADDRHVFEHFTHDASILPMEFYSHWRRNFARREKRLLNGSWGSALPPARARETIRKRIEKEGALCSRDFENTTKKRIGGWRRPPHKVALDYLWHAGVLTTSHRANFHKFYDLTERVIPPHIHGDEVEDRHQLDWLCNGALDRLGFASEGDVQRFWNAADRSEVKQWVSDNAARLRPVDIETADGGTLRAFASLDIEDRLAALPSPTSRLRIINPFDPIARDRDRLSHLFGFDYRIEIFVPAAKRKYGYYVFPMLQGDRFIGRIEVRADRKKNMLNVENIWLEPGLRPAKDRVVKLDAELERMARFVGAEEIVWSGEALGAL